ncbi:MAG: CopG family transcriptional regulator [Bacteroidetes bacterium]|nr:CopG family transcriptional regulator [Bacteroidota bacterium]
MLRTIITLSQDLKMWLDRYSRERKQSTAETIREALIEYRKKKSEEKSLDVFLSTSGLWKEKKMNGTDYSEKIRKDWETRK